MVLLEINKFYFVCVFAPEGRELPDHFVKNQALINKGGGFLLEINDCYCTIIEKSVWQESAGMQEM